jgi:hypothetical protein
MNLIEGIGMSSSSSVTVTLMGVVIIWAISAGITGMLATRKNRSVGAWAILGGIIFFGSGLLVLLFMSYLCPKCKQPISSEEARQKDCPRCRNRS